MLNIAYCVDKAATLLSLRTRIIIPCYCAEKKGNVHRFDFIPCLGCLDSLQGAASLVKYNGSPYFGGGGGGSCSFFSKVIRITCRSRFFETLCLVSVST
jgi:hypothetical protein